MYKVLELKQQHISHFCCCSYGATNSMLRPCFFQHRSTTLRLLFCILLDVTKYYRWDIKYIFGMGLLHKISLARLKPKNYVAVYMT